MEIGISTFVETTPDPQTGEVISHAQRIREVVEEIVLADQVGLDVYGVGEHHRKDYAASAPAVILAAAAAQTQRIRLTSAVTVLSSDDPVRVFQDFATLDGISNGRAEIMAGRGSFIESFPLFGYDLDNYDELFDEKLELLLKIRESEKVTWKGGHRPAIHNLGVYPRPVQNPLPVWIGSGGIRNLWFVQDCSVCHWFWRLSGVALYSLPRWWNYIKKPRGMPVMMHRCFRLHHTHMVLSQRLLSWQRISSSLPLSRA